MKLITFTNWPAAENINQYNYCYEKNAKNAVKYENQLYVHNHCHQTQDILCKLDLKHRSRV